MNNTSGYVFTKDDKNKLHLKGAWNALYLNVEDPSNLKEYPSELPNILNGFFSFDFDYLELGCGLGHHMKKVHDVAGTLSISGIDISDVCIKRAKKLSSVQFLCI